MRIGPYGRQTWRTSFKDVERTQSQPVIKSMSVGLSEVGALTPVVLCLPGVEPVDRAVPWTRK